MTSWTLALMAPYRRRIAMLGGLSLAEVALRALTPWPLKAVVDHVASNQAPPPWLDAVTPAARGPRVSLLLTIIAIGLFIQLAHQVVLMLHTRLHVRLGQSMVFALRSRLFAHLQSLSLAHHDRATRGDTVYRLEADATCIEHLLLKGVFPIAFSAITLVVMFMVLATFDLRLAGVSLAIAPALYVAMRLQSRQVKARATRTRELESRMVERAYESFSTIRLVKGFAREPHELGRFSGAATAAMRARLDLSEHESLYSLVISGVSVAGTLAVLAVGGVQVINGAITPGTLLVVMAYVGYVYGPMTAIATTSGSIQHALASARRVRDTLALPVEHNRTGAVDATGIEGRVTFDNVCFEYAEAAAVLKDIFFTAAPGEMIALVGPSGAGKTTLVSLLTRFYEATSGRVLIDGREIGEYTLQSLRERVGIVPQEGLLFSGPIFENIRYGRLDASHAEVAQAAALSGAAQFIERLPDGYSTEIAEGGTGLSGGERQRLSIARAFLKGAPILILDEPTASLDALSEARVLEAIERLREGRTTFVIAHRLSTVRRADKILVLDRGSIVASGTHAELLEASPLYAKMCAQLAQGHAA
jgi:ATP-binding cassette subfamily B protein